MTEVTFLGGSRETYVWDHCDPDAVWLGTGEVRITVVIHRAAAKEQGDDDV